MQGENTGAHAKKRYDRKRPVVSFRASREQLAKLDELIKGSGMSKGQFLRRAFGLQLEKKDKMYRKGFRDGYRKAKQKYTTLVCCKGCGEPIPVIGLNMEAMVDDAVNKVYNWYHKDCKPPNVHESECELFDREVTDD